MLAALGQVFTPSPLADLVLAIAVDLQRGPQRGPQPGSERERRAPAERVPVRVLDPACGDGVFLARAAARGLSADGVEIDPVAAAAARARTTGRVMVADFLRLPPPAVPFDVVVGNPPYIRQELVGAAKARIAARIAADWSDGPPVAWSGRADLALAFVARSLRFVKPGGRVALVVSAAILDAGYGAILDGFLAGRGRIAAVVASPRERWFRHAAVNAIILVVDRLDRDDRLDHNDRDAAPRPTVCARLRVSIDEAAARVRSLADLEAVADLRLAAPSTPLAPRLRAPDVWLAAESRAPLVPLGDLAEVRRGVTSGANGFFYLSRPEAARAGLGLHIGGQLERVGVDHVHREVPAGTPGAVGTAGAVCRCAGT